MQQLDMLGWREKSKIITMLAPHAEDVGLNPGSG